MALTLEQQEAIAEIDHNLQIIACAGSGKTEVITRRIVNILKNKTEILPENIVAFTFTEKAASSMKNRISKALGAEASSVVDRIFIGTIHGFCYHILKKYTEQFKEYRVLDTVKSHLFVARYSNESGMNELKLDPYPRNINLFLQCIDKMIDDYDNASTWTNEQRDALSKYIMCLYNHNYIDFPLMIFETLRQIDINPEVQACLSEIKYLIVDEYQDVNDIQEKLISRIVQMGANICVVGDDDQAIYQFRGSNADNMILFANRYEDVHKVCLDKNFRCAPSIVDVADCIIGHNQHRIPKEMSSGVTNLQASVTSICFSDKSKQFNGIAKRIGELHSAGIPYKEIAVLVRKGKVIPQVTLSLEATGIPYEADSAECFFQGNYFKRFVITLQILLDTDKTKLFDCWQDIVEDVPFNKGFKYLRSCARGGNRHLGEIIQGFCDNISFLDENVQDIEMRRTDLHSFIKVIDDYEEIYGDWQLSARINGVLRFLDTQAAEEYKYHNFKPKNSDIDAVQIMTVHKSKGLEFQVVFLPELVDHEFPASNIGGKTYYHILGGVFVENKHKYQSDMEDERKLFYVAVTRAKTKLFFTYELSTQALSCFVKEAAESQYLDIDRSDLSYTQKA